MGRTKVRRCLYFRIVLKKILITVLAAISLKNMTVQASTQDKLVEVCKASEEESLKSGLFVTVTKIRRLIKFWLINLVNGKGRFCGLFL